MIGWAYIGGTAVAYETWALVTGNETLTAGFRRGWRHPWVRLTIGAILGLAGAHFFEE